MCVLPGFFLRCLRDPIRVPRIENRVPRIKENYHQVLRIGENRVPRIRESGPYRVLKIFLKKTWFYDDTSNFIQF